MKLPHFCIAFVVTMVSACGGGSTDDTDALRAQAAEKETELRKLADPAPCNDNAQCGIIVLPAPNSFCGQPIPYSRISATGSEVERLTRERSEILEELRRRGPQLAAPAIACQLPSTSCGAGACVVN